MYFFKLCILYISNLEKINIYCVTLELISHQLLCCNKYILYFSKYESYVHKDNKQY